MDLRGLEQVGERAYLQDGHSPADPVPLHEMLMRRLSLLGADTAVATLREDLLVLPTPLAHEIVAKDLARVLLADRRRGLLLEGSYDDAIHYLASALLMPLEFVRWALTDGRSAADLAAYVACPESRADERLAEVAGRTPQRHPVRALSLVQKPRSIA